MTFKVAGRGRHGDGSQWRRARPHRPGAGAQNSIGVRVLGGMLTATVIGIFMVPAFHVVVRRPFGDASVRSLA